MQISEEYRYARVSFVKMCEKWKCIEFIYRNKCAKKNGKLALASDLPHHIDTHTHTHSLHTLSVIWCGYCCAHHFFHSFFIYFFLAFFGGYCSIVCLIFRFQQLIEGILFLFFGFVFLLTVTLSFFFCS